MRTLVIVEPHPLFRLGLRQLLHDVVPQLSIEGHDYSSLEKLQATPPEPCDLLLLSLTPARCSANLAGAAMTRFTPIRILLLADENEMPDSITQLPECTAGVVTKEAPPEILQASVRLVLAGGTCFPAGPARTARAVATLEQMSAPAFTDARNVRYQPANWGLGAVGAAIASPLVPISTTPSSDDSLDAEFGTPMKPGSAAHRESQLLGLTPRQYEVLLLLARGYPMKKVGRALNISVATAKAHTETLYQRLDVHNRNAAVYTAVPRGATLGWARVREAQSRPAAEGVPR